ncbi:hypothetical protein LTR70_000707 [Exophiala xenobiotica]|uniref:Uncharacterized protein n=1 Tax=Lithohypha guttulata TaxID=1690604 RepID=A0ABR0KNE2_9EURO|nr:hypothetical protein LTR24_000622 [Lithohypha guttulata]KAK5329210.1 hypothetical protein LTR70_000707 [Exophiala xenobiotica]
MFLKQTSYKPRSGSTSSSGGTEQASTPTSPPAKQAADTQQPATAAQAGRRRSSTDQAYAGLNNYKRSSVDDKRSGFAEQSAQPGVLGQMWNNFTKGK